MRPLCPALLALAALAATRPSIAAGPDASPRILEVRYEGGSAEDRAFAAAAAGLRPGALDTAALELALTSVRATDRFRRVDAGFEDQPGGRRLTVRLEPWPPIRGWSWQGDPVDRSLQAELLPGRVRGARLGALRIEALRLAAEARLHDAGYPLARVGLARIREDRDLAISIALGRPARIERLEWLADPLPYGKERLASIAGLQPGRSLWTPNLRREALARLRKRFLADRRYEWQAELAWSEDGTARIRVQPGPRIQVEFAGDRVRWTGLNDLLPFVWADRYSPDLLDQADRRILLYLNGEGYKDAQVSHRREALPEDGQGQRARIVFTVRKGPRAEVDGLVFERNREIPSEELVRAAQLPSGSFWIGAPVATPELVEAVVERIKAYYLRRGFLDVSIRRRLETRDGRTRLVLQVREGERRLIESLALLVPSAEPWSSAPFGEALFALLGERSTPVTGAPPQRPARRGERPEMGGAVGTLEFLPREPGSPLQRIRLALDRPIPFVKTDLAMVLAGLRQRIARLGTPRPLFPRLVRTEGERGERLQVEVVEQPLFQVQRLVVQGSDSTRPEAVLREAGLPAGMPLDPERLLQAQARIGNLGAFDHVDLVALAETAQPDPRPAWKEGDLLLRLQERPNWIYSTAFGYDRISGYHIGLGAQRVNFQGLGRTLDFNLRAGDATLRNPGLRNFFSTGTFRRSVDIYSIGYSDPWFSPGKIAAWLPERTEYRAEAAYLDELQPSFEVRRRRVLNGLMWKPVRGTEIRLGHRFERVEVSSIVAGLTDDDLNKATKTPGRVVISAPYLQYTRDRRDNPFDPTSGTYFFGKLELANQLWGTSKNASFIKLDLRHQWNWPVGYRAEYGVATLGARVGIARPTASSSEDLPLSERFFAGGQGTHRGVEPDFLGPITSVPLRDPATGAQLYRNGFPQYTLVPQGGQALALVNLEYRFPVSPSFWLELFVDSGQVYKSLRPSRDANDPNYDPYFEFYAFHPPFRTAVGLGLIIKLGIPIKIEYARDLRRLVTPDAWNRYQVVDPATGKVTVINEQLKDDHTTQLKNILISAGFQF